MYIKPGGSREATTQGTAVTTARGGQAGGTGHRTPGAAIAWSRAVACCPHHFPKSTKTLCIQRFRHMDTLPDDHGPRALDSPGAHAAAFDLVLRGVWEDVPLALAAGMSVHARRDPYGSLTLLHVAARQGSTCGASPACVRMLVCVCVCMCA